MKKGKVLLLLSAIALIGIISFLPAKLCAATQVLEETESGAPSAIMIFPTGEKAFSGASDMSAVAFNHLIHEKWMKKSDKDCLVCHHTGDTVACAACHTVTGKEEGGNVSLYQAMHAQRVEPKTDGTPTPSSCVSCHNKQLERRDCAGCHTTLVRDKAVQNDAWCMVCHSTTPKMTRQQLTQGIEKKLPEEDNLALASDTVLTRTQAVYISPQKSPYKVEIDEFPGGTYRPVIFNHRHHVTSLMQRIESSRLAGTFHTVPQTLCVTCHHNSPPTVKPPKCVTCHSKKITPSEPQRPALQAAYHLNCMSCHKDMKVARPRNTDCTTCHKLRAAAGEGGK